MKIPEICFLLLAAKADEAAAKEARVNLERALINAIGPLKEEGTSQTVEGGYKIKVTTKLSRKLDHEVYQSLDLPENLQFVKYKPEIDLTALRAIERIDPSLIALCVTTSPAKPTISIEEVE